MRFYLFLFILSCCFLGCKGMEEPPSDDESAEEIFDIIEKGKVYKLKALLKKSSQILLKHDGKGYYPIHTAAKKGIFEIVELLIDFGAHVDQNSFWGERALTFAALNGNLELVVYLVNNDSDPYKKDLFGRAPIAYAIIKGHQDVVNYFLSESFEVTKFFKDRDLWINGREKRTNNLLTLACCNGHKKIVENLLRAQAPVKIKDPYDVRPLKIAASKGYYEIIGLLLAYGADVNDYGKYEGPWGEDHDEATPLISAICSGHVHIVELLLNYGADKKKVHCGKDAKGYAKELKKANPLDVQYSDILILLKTDTVNVKAIKVKMQSGGDYELPSCAENGDC